MGGMLKSKRGRCVQMGQSQLGTGRQVARLIKGGKQVNNIDDKH